MEYYSDVKKNEIIQCLAKWMQPQIIILNEVSQRGQYNYHDNTYMWNLKYDINEPIYKVETD